MPFKSIDWKKIGHANVSSSSQIFEYVNKTAHAQLERDKLDDPAIVDYHIKIPEQRQFVDIYAIEYGILKKN